MFIVFGEKKALRKIGYVVERCPKCDSIQSVRIHRVGMAPHIFWLPFGRGRLVEYYGVCQQCGSELGVDPTDYLTLAKKPADNLTNLLQQTNPKLNPRNRSAVDAFDRFRRIRDPLMRANQVLLERGIKGTRFDKTSGLALLASVVIPILMFTLDLTFLSYSTQQLIGVAAIWIFVIGLIGSFVLVAREPRRFFRRELEPEIAKELIMVNPRVDEIDDCLKLIKKYEYRVGELVSSRSLVNQIQLQQFSIQ